jgi:sulfite reductase beta subunit-like hemoprotein
MTDVTELQGSEQQISELQVKGNLADNERLKRESNFLRGTITQDLDDGLTGAFNGDNFQLIRFHGMYQQDDRDIRAGSLLPNSGWESINLPKKRLITEASA